MENIQIHKKQSHGKSKILNFKELQSQFKSSMAQPNTAYNPEFENSKYFKQKPHYVNSTRKLKLELGNLTSLLKKPGS